MHDTPYREDDRAHVWHPYTRPSTLDGDVPMIVRGEGIRLIDDRERRFVDAIASWWCCSLGHGHPRLVAALRRQAGLLQHSILGNLAHPGAARLARELSSLLPTSQRKVLFASDGASAVEQAIKIAIQVRHNTGQPGRGRFACLADGYHGDTLGAMSMGYLDDFHRPFKRHLLDADRIPFPASGEFDATRSFLEPRSAEYTAVIVEPLVQGAAGMRMYPAAWLARLSEWCSARDVLLIVDEIATGFGRTGTMFAFEQAHIDPDIVCVGKALSGGYLPISATIVRDTLFETFDDAHTLQHGHTFCGNPLAAAVALEALAVYRDEHVIEQVAAKAARLRDRWHALADAPGVSNVRTLGLIAALDLAPSGRDAQGLTRPHRIRVKLMADGVLLRPLGNVLYLMPPLTITDAELDDLVARVADAVRGTP